MNKLKIAALALALAAGTAAAHEGHHHNEKAEAAGAAQTISGEIVDMACYMSGEEHGAKHAKCAGMCVTGGAPMGLLTKSGDLYLVVADHANEKPYEEAKKLAGTDVKLSGKVTTKGGVQALILAKTEKPYVPALYQLHPAAVHFPIALLVLGAAVAGARLRESSPQWLSMAESWLLWLGTLAAWGSAGLGLLAEKYAPHKPLAWETLADHKALGLWTCGVFGALALFRLWASHRAHDADRGRRVQLCFWLAGAALIAATGLHGGKLVFDFGMGLTP